MTFSDSVPKHIQLIPSYKSENPAEEIERELGVKVVQLGMNENPFGPSPMAVEAARRCMDQVAPYPDDSGFFLRRKLAAHYKVSMDELIISSGSSDILAMAYHAVLEPGAEVLTGESSFIVYYQLAEMVNMPMIRTPMKNYAFDLDAMAARITPNTRLIVIANPNNPTGTILHRQELDAFMKKVPDHALVILDEAYFEYVDDSGYPRRASVYEFGPAGSDLANIFESLRPGRPADRLRPRPA
jgi:histidinol-phosphate aminotransferase